MSKHKYTTAACIVIVIAILTLTIAFMYSPNWGVTAAVAEPKYSDKLFSTDKVHTIDIVVKETDWEDMIANAQAEEYIQASVVIDGEIISGIGIRPKGNSSLSMIASSDSDRYSFKIEFDHFSDSISYYGLDKLALNNIAQDNTYMKDYISYQMMNEMGADAPLSSFIWVTVNGKDWGLYLAAEGVEESFAQRVYGNDFGEIYKPDTMDMNDGGGFGGEHREDNFPGGRQMPNFDREDGEMPQMPDLDNIQDGDFPAQGGQMPEFNGENGETTQMPDLVGENGETTLTQNLDEKNGETTQVQDFGDGQDGNSPAQNIQVPNMGGGFGGFGGSATSLVYSDDNPDSYSAIFDNAVFDTSEADKRRLIQSLKQLNAGENIEQIVDVDEVIRYFVVHNFVLNSDSYTGSLIHNYYLAENNGKLSMIAWDYNLAFGGMGGFGGGMGGMFGASDADQSETTVDTATTLVNHPIDSPMLSGTVDSKPMISWIFDNEEYLTKYHEVFAEYMEYFNSGKFTEMYDKAIALISPYVEKDPSAFCSYEDFKKGTSALREFCLLRAKSISGQLDGTIAATSEEQATTSNTGFVDASEIDLESMGSNSMGFNRARKGQFPNGGGNNIGDNNNTIDVTTDGSNKLMTANNQAAFPAMNMRSTEASGTFQISITDVVLLIACMVVLICGLLFAKKRRA